MKSPELILMLLEGLIKTKRIWLSNNHPGALRQRESSEDGDDMMYR